MWAIQVESKDQNNVDKKPVLVTTEIAPPKLWHNEVLIKNQAFGLNHADIFQKNGLYSPPNGASDILGLEIAGVVTEVAEYVSKFKIGDRVMALVEGGAYAEFCKAPESQIFKIPDNLDFTGAAALPEALFTIYSNFFDYGKLQPGNSLLLHGGASGVGTLAVQIAKLFNVKFYTTCGSDEKCQFLENLGAVAAINYNKYDFLETIKQHTQNVGVDVIIDMVGGDYFAKNLKLLNFGGRLIYIAFLKSAKIEANLANLLFKNLHIVGTTLRSKSLAEKSLLAQNIESKILPYVADGTIKPVIAASYNYKEVEKAHNLMESRQHIGKIILHC